MRKFYVLACIMLICGLGSNSFGQTATAPTGDGSIGTPYQIATLENLYWIASQLPTQQFANKNFIQTADIDASATSGWNSGAGWLPIGNSTNKFLGNYDGQGHVISGLYINRPTTDNIGLFGYVSTQDTIQNLSVTNVNINGQSYVGALLGQKPFETSTTTILNCHSTGTVTGKRLVGGLIGSFTGSGNINRSYSNATVYVSIADQYYGGLVGGLGSNGNAAIINVSDCYATGAVTGAQYAAGFCSGFWGTGSITLTNCYSTGAISGTSTGGFTGVNFGNTINVTNCYWDKTTSVQASSDSGTGYVTADMQTQAKYVSWDFGTVWSINPSYNNGYPYLQAFSAPSNFIQLTTEAITGTTNTSVTGNGTICNPGKDGSVTHYGVCCNTSQYPTTSNIVFDNGSTSSAGVFSGSLTGLAANTTYYARAYATNSLGTVYGNQISFTTTPISPVQPSTGDGSSGNPYQISSLSDLYWMSYQSNYAGNTFSGKYFKQTANIDASSTSSWYSNTGWLPIGNSNTTFNGNYDGQGYTISGLYINRPTTNNIGLFGRTGQSSIYLKNIKLTNINITGQNYCGALCGFSDWYNNGIQNCYSSGTVSGKGTVGGLIGMLYNLSGTNRCYSSCTVSGVNGNTSNFGGLVGQLQGYSSGFISVLNDSYATGNVTGNDKVGGLIGYANTVSGTGGVKANRCYSTGAVSGTTNVAGLIGNIQDASATITNSFWNTATSGQASGYTGTYTLGTGITGKTTANMQTQSTFTGAAWDFIGETTNGSNDYWGMSDLNNGYPLLTWQCPIAQSATNITTTSFTANWRAIPTTNWSSAPTISYLLDVATDAAFTQMVSGYNGLSVSSTSQTVTGLTANTIYYFRVRYVYNGLSVSTNSNIISLYTIPQLSVGSNEYWHYIQFKAKAAVLADQGTGNQLKTEGIQPMQAKQLWKIEDAGGGYYILTSQLGNKIAWNGASNYISSASGTNIKLLSTSTSYQSGFELQRTGSTSNMNQSGGAGPGKTLGEYTAGDSGNPLIFVPASQYPVYPKLSSGGNTYYYYIQFKSGSAVAADQGASNDLKTEAISNGATKQLWKVEDAASNGYITLTSQLGNKMTWGTSYTTNATTGTNIRLVPTSNTTYPNTWELQRTGSSSNMNQSGGGGVGKTLSEWTGGDPANNLLFVPSAPTTNAASSITKNSFIANWNPSGGNGSYFLDVSTSATFTSFVTGYNNLSITNTSQSVTGLTANTTYYYRVRSSDGMSGDNSATITVVTLPAAPTATAASAISASGFTTNWTAPSQGAATFTYTVEYGSTSDLSGTNTTIANIASTNLSQAISSLSSNSPYYYHVKAVNATGSGAWSAILSTITLPNAPNIGTATAGNAQASITFTAPGGSATITGYTVTSTPGSLTRTGTTSPIIFTGLTNGTTYTFTVTATNATGTSAASIASNAVTPDATANIINVSTNTNTSSLTLTPVSDITVSNGALLTIDNTVNVNNIIVAPTAKLTNGGTLNARALTLQSNDTGTGTYLDNGTTTIATVTTQQYLSSARNWYISSAISGATVPLGNTYFGYSEAGDNTGTALGETPYWKAYTEGSPLQVGKGYIVITGSATTLQFSGQLNNGNKTVNLTKKSSGDKAGFNLIANPYPSYLNVLPSVTANSNLEGTVWYRTLGNETTPLYHFETVNAASGIGTNTAGTGKVTGHIPPMQSFWVKTNVDNQTITFLNTNRSHATTVTTGAGSVPTTLLKVKRAESTEEMQPILRLQVSNGAYIDETIIYFNDSASNGLDNYDSQKMRNHDSNIPEIYTTTASAILTINGLNPSALNSEQLLGFTGGNASQFTLKASEISHFNPNSEIILKDKLYNTQFNLAGGDAYTFTSDTGNLTSTDRFSIIFKASKVFSGTDKVFEQPEIKVSRNKNNRIVIYSNKDISTYTATVYNGIGQKICRTKLTKTITELSNISQSGSYIVTLTNGKQQINTKIVLQ